MKENVKEKWITELLDIANKLPAVELKRLLWFARAFKETSAQK